MVQPDFVREKTSFGKFQDCGHLRYRNGMMPCCCLTLSFSSIRITVLLEIGKADDGQQAIALVDPELS